MSHLNDESHLAVTMSGGWYREQPAAQLPWGHLMVLLDRVRDPQARDWYAGQDAVHGWSRAILVHHTSANRHPRIDAAPNNFPANLPAHESDMARDILQDRCR